MGFNQFSLAVGVMIMMVLLKPNSGRAAVLLKSNTTYKCNSLLNGCPIGEELQTELEFFMGSDVIRILQSVGINQVTGGTINALQKAIKCPKGVSYSKCLAPGDNKHCGQYKRDCH